jgi:HEAT repeat protein
VLPDLFAASRSPDADIRYLAANGLEEINDPSVTDAFVRLLADPVEKVRLVSLRGLQSRTEKRIVPSLLPHLKNSDAYVRGEIALVLGKFGDAAVLQGIKNAVEKEKVPETRKKMQLASARLGDASEREKICEQLTMKNPDSVLTSPIRGLRGICFPPLVIRRTFIRSESPTILKARLRGFAT